MTEQFAADWLALREPFDHAARSVALARRLADRLPLRRPRLVDLGAGTGGLFRYLAPLIERGQDWLLIDADGALLDEAFGYTAAWARRRGYAATAEEDELRISTPHGLWRMQAKVGDLRRDRLDQFQTDAIVSSALLDLVSAHWLDRLCGTLVVPLLACLSVDGRDVWRPRHQHDALVRKGYRRDMHRDKGFGLALGVDAPRMLLRRNAASAPSDWHIPRTALQMQRALIDGTADAARRSLPDHVFAITAWQEARLAQALRGRLAITIGHRDILVLPPGG